MIHEAMSYLPGLLTVYAVCALGLLSPGPNVMSVIGTAMGGGRRKAVAMALGISLGTGLWACATVAGLGALMTRYAELMIVLRVAGGCYLLWLAVKSLRAAIGPLKLAPTEPCGSSSAWGAFLRPDFPGRPGFVFAAGWDCRRFDSFMLCPGDFF